MPNKTIIALDLATQMGWAAGCPGETPEMGSESLRGRSGHDGEKFCILIDWLAVALQRYKPVRVIYEAPVMTMPEGKTDETGRRRGGNAKTMAALIGMAVTVEMLCFRYDIVTVKSSSSTARKWFIGHGRHPEPKPAVMAECKRRGWKPVDHNASDAAALWDYACGLYYPNDYKRSYAAPVRA